MWNWLKSAYNGTIGALSAIEKWIVAAITAVYSYFDQLITQLWNGLSWLGDELNQLYAQIVRVLTDIQNAINWVVDIGIPRLANWVQGELDKVYGFVNSIINWVNSLITKLEAWVGQQLEQIAQWALRNIWDPIWNYVQGLARWIANEGAYVYDLLTHPEKLAALLGKYLLAAWMGLGQKYAKPFVRWILHSAMSEASTVGAILEDIITSLF